MMEKWRHGGNERLAKNLEVPFYEGDFLRILLSKVERMLDSRYGTYLGIWILLQERMNQCWI